MNRTRLLPLVETAVMVALAYVLNLITVFRMPQGGSITAGSVIPILIIGLRHGTGWGVGAGVAFGFLQAFFGGYVIHPVQMLLDYPIAFGLLGLSGLAARKSTGMAGLAIALAVFGRFVAHVISGVVYFGSGAAPGQNVWAFSIAYNASYYVPDMLVSGLLLFLLHPALRRLLSAGPQTKGAV